jgi:hypothetical protein
LPTTVLVVGEIHLARLGLRRAFFEALLVTLAAAALDDFAVLLTHFQASVKGVI